MRGRAHDPRRATAARPRPLALARALLRDVPLLLLDEPTAHLAPAAAASIDEVIRGPMAGHTIIVATHQYLGTAGASQVITLGGRLAETGCRPAGTPALAVSP
jgi:ATP-binding cassette, subfamily C, bacterial CydD